MNSFQIPRARRFRNGSNASGSGGSSQSTLDSISEEIQTNSYSYGTRRHTADVNGRRANNSRPLKMCRADASPNAKRPDFFMIRSVSTVVRSDSTSSEGEILTPFDAVRDLKREGPAYWISCSYIHRPKSRHVDLTLRQTGVLPDIECIKNCSKLTLEVTIQGENIKKQRRTVVLKGSKADNSFKSSHTDFSNVSEGDLATARIRFRIFARKWVVRNQVAEWVIDLNDCHNKLKSQVCRVSFRE